MWTPLKTPCPICSQKCVIKIAPFIKLKTCKSPEKWVSLPKFELLAQTVLPCLAFDYCVAYMAKNAFFLSPRDFYILEHPCIALKRFFFFQSNSIFLIEACRTFSHIYPTLHKSRYSVEWQNAYCAEESSCELWKSYVLEKRILFGLRFANLHISKPESHFTFIAVLSAHIRLGATLKSPVQLTNKRGLLLCPFHSSDKKVGSIKCILFNPYYGLTCGTEGVLSMIIVSLEARFWPILMWQKIPKSKYCSCPIDG